MYLTYGFILLRKNSIDFRREFFVSDVFWLFGGKKETNFSALFKVVERIFTPFHTKVCAGYDTERERGRETEKKRLRSKRRRFVCLCVVRSICVVLKGLLSHKLDLLRGKLQSIAEKKSDFANKTTCAMMMITGAVASSST